MCHAVRRQRGEEGRADTRPCLLSRDLYFNLLIELNRLCAPSELHLITWLLLV